MRTLKVKLVHIEDHLGLAFEKYFEDIDNVEIVKNDITNIEVDAIVSPANSFGFMDGGLDFHLSQRFGWNLQEQLQQKIFESELGELLVGQALVLDTNDDNVPYLISAPTMRVPMSFNINTSVNAYLAAKAIFSIALKHPCIGVLALPGLCTGSGKMNPEIAALQMRMAFDEIVLKKKPKFDSFRNAQEYQLQLNREGRLKS